MFSEMITNLKQGKMPDPVGMAKRFDFALTKKLGIVKLPPAFWMSDPKINPRTDHLFWAGDSHKVNQDYCLSGSKSGLHYAIVSDGCSSSPDTDFGSRILAKAAENNI